MKCPPVAGFDPPDDSVLRLPVPNGGLQPQMVVDSSGVLHLIYFAGVPAGGDLFVQSPAANGVRVSQQLFHLGRNRLLPRAGLLGKKFKTI